MTLPFEDPNKTHLREQFSHAIDFAGYRLILPPESVPLPADSEWKGTILPDIQFRDDQGFLHNLYVRPGKVGSKPTPQWLANLARASHDLSKTLVYIATEESGEELENSCRTVGAGLMVLREGLRLDRAVDPREITPAIVST